MINIKNIQQRINSILEFMDPNWKWVNCHMVNFLTDNHWNSFVPDQLRAEITDVACIEECITDFWNTDSEMPSNKYPELQRFLKQSRDHSLRNFPELNTSVTELREQLGLKTESESLSIAEFLSGKKKHEVEATASLVNDLLSFDSMQNKYVIDAGDGLGYLSSRIALEYNHRVLGIDCNSANTENALGRNKKLQKVWNGLKAKAKSEMEGLVPEKKLVKTESVACFMENDRYKTTARFITPSLNFKNLINEYFPETMSTSSNDVQLLLVGLHTCGNLASNCLKAFHTQVECKILCNIGCCYHLLKESYSGQEFFGNKEIMEKQNESGFPMSKYLQDKTFKLGRNSRMLAAQSIDRTLFAKELPNISLFYRALLEVVICEKDPNLRDTIQVGKIRKFNSFKEYVEICCKKIPDLDIPLEKINDVEERFGPEKLYLDLFYLLRMTFAPVLESLILLDRLLYLHELGYGQSYLVPLFDPIVSPRHYAIVAIKK